MSDSQKIFQLIRNPFDTRMKEITQLSRSAQAFLDRSIYPTYQRAQEQRWMTENRSEGAQWKAVSDLYNRRKIKDRIRDRERYPGGPRIGLHTGALSRSVIGTDLRNHRKVISGNKITVATTLAYAGFFAEVRPFMAFGENTKKTFRDKVLKYWRGIIQNRLGSSAGVFE